MKLLRALVILGCLVPAPLAAIADPSPPTSTDPATAHGRLVPVVRDGKPIGLKVYAIKPGGRFDQPTAKFENGDTILEVDGEPVITDAGTRALHDKVLLGQADARVTVQRRGSKTIEVLESKAVR